MSYYVYQLVDPRDGKPFYVGKGKGCRIKEHFKAAKAGRAGKRLDRIRQIVAANLAVIEDVLQTFESEDDAYDFEVETIKRIGLENLTNISCGGRIQFPMEPQDVKDARNVIPSLSRMARKLSVYREVGFRFGGMWHDIDRAVAIQILSNGVHKAFEKLGESAARSEFAKYNVRIVENRA